MVNRYIENIVIGKPLCDPIELFALDKEDWENNERDKTYFTHERYLPKILVELGVYPSTSEIRRNKPELFRTLNDLDFLDKLKVSKKRYVWICVGQDG